MVSNLLLHTIYLKMTCFNQYVLLINEGHCEERINLT